MEKMSNRKELGFQRAKRNASSSSSSSSSSSFSSSSSYSSSNWRSLPTQRNNRDTKEEKESSYDTPTLVGTCPDMCPGKERAQRERLRDLSVFERLNGNPARTSPDIAVKKFCRTISSNDVRASDLRPLTVLKNTLKYLLELVESSDQPFEVVHDFVFDRTRSIRQDLSMQQIVDNQAMHMYEEMGDSLNMWFRQLPSLVLHSKEMQFSRTILRYFRIGNYKSFLNTVATKASHLQLCLLEPLLNEVRVQAISYINYCGYKLHPYPLTHLSEFLLIEEKQLVSLCCKCGLEIITDEAGCKLLPAKQSNFCPPKSGFPSYGLAYEVIRSNVQVRKK